MNRDINEVEREAMKDVTFYFFFGDRDFFFQNPLFPCAEFLLFCTLSQRL